MFELGDRVQYHEFGEGTVISTKIDGYYLIEFDKENATLHDGSGWIAGLRGKSNHCWWCSPQNLSKCGRKITLTKYEEEGDRDGI